MLFFQKKDLDKLKKDLKDQSTQLNNKIALYHLMDHILTQYQRYEENWSFIILECSLNNTVSSSCPDITQDKVDKVVSERLKSICRKSDILFYCSSGLFCILTRVFEGDDIVRFCQKLSENLKELRSEQCNIAVSPKFGLTFSKVGDTPETFSQRSLQALKKSQKSKENIIVQT